MTTMLGLAAIEAVRIPPLLPPPRTYPPISDAELRATFTDSFGPLVAPFPTWPGLWHQGQSPVAAFMRAAELVRLGGNGTQLAKMAPALPSGGFIQPPRPVEPPVAPATVRFPEWVR
jgi:hypothetical protein